VIVRRGGDADVRDAVLVAAAVAEEDFLRLQPPVDLEARAERFRELSSRTRDGTLRSTLIMAWRSDH
jgi:hypothetical protein